MNNHRQIITRHININLLVHSNLIKIIHTINFPELFTKVLIHANLDPSAFIIFINKHYVMTNIIILKKCTLENMLTQEMTYKITNNSYFTTHVSANIFPDYLLIYTSGSYPVKTI